MSYKVHECQKMKENKNIFLGIFLSLLSIAISYTNTYIEINRNDIAC